MPRCASLGCCFKAPSRHEDPDAEFTSAQLKPRFSFNLVDGRLVFTEDFPSAPSTPELDTKTSPQALCTSFKRLPYWNVPEDSGAQKEADASLPDTTSVTLTDDSLYLPSEYSDSVSVSAEFNSRRTSTSSKWKSEESLSGLSNYSRKKWRRNRSVDIEDIEIELDPVKDYMYEIAKKYEEYKCSRNTGNHGEHVNRAFVSDEDELVIEENLPQSLELSTLSHSNESFLLEDSITITETSQTHDFQSLLITNGATVTSKDSESQTQTHCEQTELNALQESLEEELDATQKAGESKSEIQTELEKAESNALPESLKNESDATIKKGDSKSEIQTELEKVESNALPESDVTIKTRDSKSEIQTELEKVESKEESDATIKTIESKLPIQTESEKAQSNALLESLGESDSLQKSVDSPLSENQKVDAEILVRSVDQDSDKREVDNTFLILDEKEIFVPLADVENCTNSIRVTERSGVKSDLPSNDSIIENQCAECGDKHRELSCISSPLSISESEINNIKEDTNIVSAISLEHQSISLQQQPSSPPPEEELADGMMKTPAQLNTSLLSIESYTLTCAESEESYPNHTICASEDSCDDSSVSSFELPTPPLSPSACSFDSDLFPEGDIEIMVVHRLPGEQLGMGLTIEGIGDKESPVKGVFVDSVVPGGPAFRATGSRQGINVGDEILEVNGSPFTEMTHSEAVEFFQAMPLRVILTVKRGVRKPSDSSFQVESPQLEKLDRVSMVTTALPSGEETENQLQDLPENDSEFESQNREHLVEVSEMNFEHHSVSVDETNGYQDLDDDDDYNNERNDFDLDHTKKVPEGFQFVEVRLHKQPSQSLGLTIVPSYGSTKYYYQVKRVLHSGICAKDGQVKVGDRLVSFNGQNLRNRKLNECMNILKQQANDITFQILRPKNDIIYSINDTKEEVIGDTVATGNITTIWTPEQSHSTTSLKDSDFQSSDSLADFDNVLSTIEVEDLGNASNSSSQLIDQNLIFARRSVRLPISRNLASHNAPQLVNSDAESSSTLGDHFIGHLDIMDVKNNKKSKETPEEISDIVAHEAVMLLDIHNMNDPRPPLPVTDLDAEGDFENGYVVSSSTSVLPVSYAESGSSPVHEHALTNPFEEIEREFDRDISLEVSPLDYSHSALLVNKTSQLNHGVHSLPIVTIQSVSENADEQVVLTGYGKISELQDSDIPRVPKPPPMDLIDVQGTGSIEEGMDLSEHCSRQSMSGLEETTTETSFGRERNQQNGSGHWVMKQIQSIEKNSGDSNKVPDSQTQKHSHETPSLPQQGPTLRQMESIEKILVFSEENSSMKILSPTEEERFSFPETTKSTVSDHVDLQQNKSHQVFTSGDSDHTGISNNPTSTPEKAFQHSYSEHRVPPHFISPDPEQEVSSCYSQPDYFTVNGEVINSSSGEEANFTANNDNLSPVTQAPAALTDPSSQPVTNVTKETVAMETHTYTSTTSINLSLTLPGGMKENTDESSGIKLSNAASVEEDKSSGHVSPTIRTSCASSALSGSQDSGKTSPDTLREHHTVNSENENNALGTSITSGTVAGTNPTQITLAKITSETEISHPQFATVSTVTTSSHPINDTSDKSPTKPDCEKSPAETDTESEMPDSNRIISNTKSHTFVQEKSLPSLPSSPEKDSIKINSQTATENHKDIKVFQTGPYQSTRTPSYRPVKPLRPLSTLKKSPPTNGSLDKPMIIPVKSNKLPVIRSSQIANSSLTLKHPVSINKIRTAKSTSELDKTKQELTKARPASWSHMPRSDENVTLTPRAGSETKCIQPMEHQKRTDAGPFQVDIIKGILGIGLKVKVNAEGQVLVTEVQPKGPAGKTNLIRVGDQLLSVNNTQLSGLSEVHVQQTLNALPRGLLRLIFCTPTKQDHSTVSPDSLQENMTSAGENVEILAANEKVSPLSSRHSEEQPPRHSRPEVNHKVRSSLDSDTGSSEGDIHLPTSPRLPPDGHEFPDEFADSSAKTANVAQTVGDDNGDISDSSSDEDINHQSVLQEVIQSYSSHSLPSKISQKDSFKLFELAAQMEASSVDNDGDFVGNLDSQEILSDCPPLPQAAPPGVINKNHESHSSEESEVVQTFSADSHMESDDFNVEMDDADFTGELLLPSLPPPSIPSEPPPSIPLEGVCVTESCEDDILPVTNIDDLVLENNHEVRDNDSKTEMYDKTFDSGYGKETFSTNIDQNKENVITPVNSGHVQDLNLEDRNVENSTFSYSTSRPGIVPPLILSPRSISSNTSPRSFGSQDTSSGFVERDQLCSPPALSESSRSLDNLSVESPRSPTKSIETLSPQTVISNIPSLSHVESPAISTIVPVRRMGRSSYQKAERPRSEIITSTTPYHLSDMSVLSNSTDSLGASVNLQGSSEELELSRRSSADSLDSLSSTDSYRQRRSYAPPLKVSPSEKRSSSLIKTIEERRKSTGTRLRGLQIPSKRLSVSSMQSTTLPTLSGGKTTPPVGKITPLVLSPRPDLAKNRLSPSSTTRVALRPIDLGRSPRASTPEHSKTSGQSVESPSSLPSNRPTSPVNFDLSSEVRRPLFQSPALTKPVTSAKPIALHARSTASLPRSLKLNPTPLRTSQLSSPTSIKTKFNVKSFSEKSHQVTSDKHADKNVSLVRSEATSTSSNSVVAKTPPAVPPKPPPAVPPKPASRRSKKPSFTETDDTQSKSHFTDGHADKISAVMTESPVEASLSATPDVVRVVTKVSSSGTPDVTQVLREVSSTHTPISPILSPPMSAFSRPVTKTAKKSQPVSSTTASITEVKSIEGVDRVSAKRDDVSSMSHTNCTNFELEHIEAAPLPPGNKNTEILAHDHVTMPEPLSSNHHDFTAQKQQNDSDLVSSDSLFTATPVLSVMESAPQNHQTNQQTSSLLDLESNDFLADHSILPVSLPASSDTNTCYDLLGDLNPPESVTTSDLANNSYSEGENVDLLDWLDKETDSLSNTGSQNAPVSLFDELRVSQISSSDLVFSAPPQNNSVESSASPTENIALFGDLLGDLLPPLPVTMAPQQVITSQNASSLETFSTDEIFLPSGGEISNQTYDSIPQPSSVHGKCLVDEPTFDALPDKEIINNEPLAVDSEAVEDLSEFEQPFCLQSTDKELAASSNDLILVSNKDESQTKRESILSIQDNDFVLQTENTTDCENIHTEIEVSESLIEAVNHKRQKDADNETLTGDESLIPALPNLPPPPPPQNASSDFADLSDILAKNLIEDQQKYNNQSKATVELSDSVEEPILTAVSGPMQTTPQVENETVKPPDLFASLESQKNEIENLFSSLEASKHAGDSDNSVHSVNNDSRVDSADSPLKTSTESNHLVNSVHNASADMLLNRDNMDISLKTETVNVNNVHSTSDKFSLIFTEGHTLTDSQPSQESSFMPPPLPHMLPPPAAPRNGVTPSTQGVSLLDLDVNDNDINPHNDCMSNKEKSHDLLDSDLSCLISLGDETATLQPAIAPNIDCTNPSDMTSDNLLHDGASSEKSEHNNACTQLIEINNTEHEKMAASVLPSSDEIKKHSALLMDASSSDLLHAPPLPASSPHAQQSADLTCVLSSQQAESKDEEESDAPHPLPEMGPPKLPTTAPPPLPTTLAPSDGWNRNESPSPTLDGRTTQVIPRTPPPTLPRPFYKSPPRIHEVVAPKSTKVPPPTKPKPKSVSSQKPPSPQGPVSVVTTRQSPPQSDSSLQGLKTTTPPPPPVSTTTTQSASDSLKTSPKEKSSLTLNTSLKMGTTSSAKSPVSPGSATSYRSIFSSEELGIPSSKRMEVSTSNGDLILKQSPTRSPDTIQLMPVSPPSAKPKEPPAAVVPSSDETVKQPGKDSSVQKTESPLRARRLLTYENDQSEKVKEKPLRSSDDFRHRYSRLSGEYNISSLSKYSSVKLTPETRFKPTNAAVTPKSTVSNLPTEEVELKKGAVGLGFCIEGGKDSPMGDRPITVKRIFKGGGAALGLLNPGDEIVSANGKDFTNLSHYAAWNYLKSLPEGAIKLTIRRKAPN